jgi:hypothetical protein
MSDLKIAVPGLIFQTELSTTQVPIAIGGSGTFAVSNNLATITFTSAHGLTMAPAAGTLGNYFIQFNGVTGQSGVGTLNGPIFRILAIPSTTTIVIYTTVTAATVTSANAVPVFIPEFTAVAGSAFVGGPTVGTPAVVTQGALQATGNCNFLLGANCTVQYNPDNTSIIEDSTSGPTLATAPVFRICSAVSTGGQIWFDGTGGTALFASGSAGTTRISVIE